MLRKLGWLAVALFVVADVVLIALALRHTRPEQGSSAATTVTITTRVSDTRSGGAGVGGMAHALGTGSSTPLAPATGSQSPAGSQSSAVGSMATTTTAASEASTDTPVTTPSTGTNPTTPTSGTGVAHPPVGPAMRLTLDMSSDGQVIRAIRGACPSQTPTTIQVSGDGGSTWSTVDTDSPVVLRIGAMRGGHLWYIGTTAGCQAQEQDTADGGTTWTTDSTDGSWYLDVDPASHTLQAPHHSSDAGCPPVALAGIDAEHAALACTDGDVRTTTDGGTTWTTRSTLPGVVAISFTSADTGYALAATASCAAQVLVTADGAATWTPRACLAGQQARGIAAAGSQVLAQVDGTLHASDDGGVTWKTVP
jgi:hypothetical protein